VPTNVQASPYGTSVRDFRDEPRPSPFRLDPLLLLATVGLMACSLYTIATATADDIPGSPYYFVIRQAAYFAVGFALMREIAKPMCASPDKAEIDADAPA
jgi:rod shape determining protein RodA